MWRLGPPEFEVGGVVADDEYHLAELGGVTLLDNGNVLVGDRVAPFLKLFAPDGSLLRQLGRRGSGPGEYEYVYQFDWCAPGELWVFDVDRRVHRYSGSLDFISTALVSLDHIGGGVGYQRDCHPNGLQIATGWGDVIAQIKAGIYDATGSAALLRGTDLVHHFGERLSSQRLGSVDANGSPTGSAPHPFGRATVVAMGSARAYIGDGASYEIQVYDLEGSPQTPIRWNGPDLAYDDDLLEILERRALAEAPEEARPRLRRWYAEMPELDQVPAYDRILVSDSDEVWVRQFVAPDADGEEWLVFDQAHVAVGRIRLPDRSTLWEVRGNRVLYSVLDEFDVPVVRISRIER